VPPDVGLSMIKQNGAIRAQSFAEILEDVAHESTRDNGVRFSNAAGQDWLASLLKSDSVENEPANDVAAAFFAEQDEAPPFDRFEPEDAVIADPPEPAVEVETVLDLDEDRITAELGLRSAKTVAALKKARRLFALRNHPDRFHPSLRDKATARMQLANMLLDRRHKEIDSGR
jgi:hypothetical protein